MRKLNKTKIRNAIPGSMGIYATIAERCDVSRAAITLFLQKEANKNLVKELQQEKEKVIDTGEKKLMGLVEKSNFRAIELLLTTRGKDRGYMKTQQIESHVTHGPMVVNIIKPEEEKKDERKTTSDNQKQ